MTKRAGTFGNGGNFSSLCAGQYYGPESTETKSSNIIVADGEIVWVHATNLAIGDIIRISQVICGECSPYMPLPCVELCMTVDSPSIALGVSGTYVMEINPEALGQASVFTNINCDQDNYMAWLSCYKEDNKVAGNPFPYKNECATGVTDASGALDVLFETTKELEALAEVDNDTTYALTGSEPDPDDPAICIITLTGSDGTQQTATIAKPPVEEGLYLAAVPPVFDAATSSFIYETAFDAGEGVGPPVIQDISGLMTLLTSPTYVPGDNITFTTLADGNIEISSQFVDTTIPDTFVTFTQTETECIFTPADGGTPIVIPKSATSLGCDGSPLSPGSRVLSYEELIARTAGLNVDWEASAEDPCVPAEADTCFDGMRLYTHKPKDENGFGGDLFVRPTGSNMWELANISAGRRTLLVTAEQQTYDVTGAQLAAMAAGDQLEVLRIAYELTNTDCVPWHVRGHSRVAVQRTAWRPNTNWNFTISGGPTQAGIVGAGTGITYWDDSANSDPSIFSHHDIDTEWYRQTPLPPGQTVVFDVVFNLNKVNGVAYPDAAANNPLRLNSPLLLIDVDRTCQQFDPFVSGVQTA